MPEALSSSEVGKEIAEHSEHHKEHVEHGGYRLAVDRFRPAYRRAFDSWVRTHPLKQPARGARPVLPCRNTGSRSRRRRARRALRG